MLYVAITLPRPNEARTHMNCFISRLKREGKGAPLRAPWGIFTVVIRSDRYLGHFMPVLRDFICTVPTYEQQYKLNSEFDFFILFPR